jgi:hypothetical protein
MHKRLLTFQRRGELGRSAAAARGMAKAGLLGLIRPIVDDLTAEERLGDNRFALGNHTIPDPGGVNIHPDPLSADRVELIHTDPSATRTPSGCRSAGVLWWIKKSIDEVCSRKLPLIHMSFMRCKQNSGAGSSHLSAQ